MWPNEPRKFPPPPSSEGGSVKFLFLDIDGVLNPHEKLSTGYCGICRERAALLNKVLDAVPDVQIVISSAWRYMMLNGSMGLKGFEFMLLIHGIRCRDRVHGHTCADGDVCEEPPHDDVETWRKIGLTMRAAQISRYVAEHGAATFAVVDDLPIDVPNLVLTDSAVGLTEAHVDLLIGILKGSAATEHASEDGKGRE